MLDGMRMVAVIADRGAGPFEVITAPLVVRSSAVCLTRAQPSMAPDRHVTVIAPPAFAAAGTRTPVGLGKSASSVMRTEAAFETVVPSDATTSQMYDLP